MYPCIIYRNVIYVCLKLSVSRKLSVLEIDMLCIAVLYIDGSKGVIVLMLANKSKMLKNLYIYII